jgi:hypothetical protein
LIEDTPQPSEIRGGPRTDGSIGVFTAERLGDGPTETLLAAATMATRPRNPRSIETSMPKL